MANLYGNFIWRVCLAGQTGSFTQRLKARKHCKANEIEKNGMYYGGSVNCDIIM
jgi:hypothetical protein